MRMRDITLILLYFIGCNFRINLIGEIPISDIFVACYFIFYLARRYKKNSIKDADLAYIAKLYILLFLVQFVMEILVVNEVKNIARGLAVTVLSFMKFAFVWFYFHRSNKNIMYAFLCAAFVSLFSIENAEGVTEAEILDGTSSVAFSFFKFKIAPLIGLSIVVLSLVKPSWNIGALFVISGLACIVLGARSTGLMIFMTGVIGGYIKYTRKLNAKKIFTFSAFFGCIGYLLFVLYVNAVLSGEITGGNSAVQFKTVKNPYNPLYILLSGRTESPASIAAIADKPLTGFGAWAPDPGYKYHIIQAQFQGDVIDRRKLDGVNIIPAHSVLLQSGVNNGIFALGIVAFLLYFFMSKGGKSLDKKNPYLFLVVYCLMQLTWNGLFSPLSHLRGMFPFYFAVCLYSYKYMLSKNHEKNISNYCHAR